MEGGGILSAAALFLLGTLQALHAQKNPFLEQIRNFPQEKIHVTTDRDAYIAGDTVWLRAHCVDAATLEPLTASRYVYVELRTTTTCSCAASRFCNAAASMPATCPCPRRSRRTNTCCAPTRSTCATSAATISSRNPFRSIPTDNPKNDGAARRQAPSTWPSSPKAATSSTDSPAAWGSRPWARTDFRGR